MVDDPDPIDDGDGNCPDPNQTTISASVADPSGIQSVILHFRFVDPPDTGSWNAAAATFNGNSGKWEYTVDPPDLIGSLSGTIDWYFEATDNSNNTSFNPLGAPATYQQTSVNYCD